MTLRTPLLALLTKYRFLTRARTKPTTSAIQVKIFLASKLSSYSSWDWKGHLQVAIIYVHYLTCCLPLLLLQSLMQGICLMIKTVPRANVEAYSYPARLAHMRS